MAEHNILYFRDLWQKNTLDLEHHCEEWEEISSDKLIPDDVKGEIRTAIGLARLLMNQKLKQFKGLIDDSEFKTGEKEITCTDLEGFWDMVFCEVEKIQKSFSRLNMCKNNDWKFVEEAPEKHTKKVPVKKAISAINNKKELSKAQTLAAKQRIAELRKKMAAARRDFKDENKVEILLSNEKGHTKAINDITVLTHKPLDNESNEKRKSNRQVSGKKSMTVENNDLSRESSELNSPLIPKSAQKKKLKTPNKENVVIDSDSYLKHSPTKQGKFDELAIKEQGKSVKKRDYGKLQCLTRSAKKRELFNQQNSLQK